MDFTGKALIKEATKRPMTTLTGRTAEVHNLGSCALHTSELCRMVARQEKKPNVTYNYKHINSHCEA